MFCSRTRELATNHSFLTYLCILASWSKTPAVQQLRIDWKIGLVTDTWGQRGIVQDEKAAGVAETAST